MGELFGDFDLADGVERFGGYASDEGDLAADEASVVVGGDGVLGPSPVGDDAHLVAVAGVGGQLAAVIGNAGGVAPAAHDVVVVGDTTEGFGIEAQDAEGGLVIMNDTDRFADRFPDSGRECAPLGEFHALWAVESEQFEGDVGGLDGDGDGGRGVDGVVGEGDLISLVIFEAAGGGVRLTVDLEREERAAMAIGDVVLAAAFETPAVDVAVVEVQRKGVACKIELGFVGPAGDGDEAKGGENGQNVDLVH